MTKRQQLFILIVKTLSHQIKINKLISSINSILFNHTIVKTQKTPS